MNKNNTNISKTSFFSAFLLLSILIFLIYSNTLNASWQFDDYSNIIVNTNLHINQLNLSSILKTFFAHPYNHSVLYRPVACLSLALNYYFRQFDVTGYHLVNITIHIIGAFVLFLTIINLFKSPNLIKKEYQRKEYFIALLAATLWAINPIQIQAVTYIVQRMTSLSGMFYILSLYFYIKGRLRSTDKLSYLFFLCCFVSILLAFGSKENAATLPVAFLLIEIIFFQNIQIPKNRKLIIYLTVITGLIVIFICSVVYISGGGELLILKGYNNRPFNLFERLLSTPRVLLFYLSQIFYPVPQRLAIQHDFIVSTSFFEPWTTLPALLVILLLLFTGFLLIRKKPIISFAILFFFLNHIIESTILPLEIIFEHRNYTPSFFLFFPIAVGLKQGLDYYHLKNHTIFFILVLFGICLIVLTGTGTYVRNSTWLTEKLLWEDTLKKAPGIASPYQKIAKYYTDKQKYGIALKFYQKALLLNTQTLKHTKIVSLTNIGIIYHKTHEYDEAIKYYKKALNIEPDNKQVRYNYIVTLISIKKFDEASKQTDLLLKTYNNHGYYLNTKGFILLKQKKYKEALFYLRKALHTPPHNNDVLLNIGTALSFIGNYKQADMFFNLAKKIAPSNITGLLHLIENSIRSNNKSDLDKYTIKLLSSFKIVEIKNTLQDISNDNSSTLLSYQLLAPAITEAVSKISKEITTF